jgi:hypothetical protein
MGESDHIDQFLSSAVKLSTELQLHVHPDILSASTARLDLLSRKAQCQLFWYVYELDCYAAAMIGRPLLLSHFNPPLQITAPDPLNFPGVSAAAFVPEKYLQSEAVTMYTSSRAQNMKAAFLAMTTNHLMGIHPVNHAEWDSLSATLVQFVKPLQEKHMESNPSNEIVALRGTMEIIAHASFAHLHTDVIDISRSSLSAIATVCNSAGLKKISLKPIISVSSCADV